MNAESGESVSLELIEAARAHWSFVGGPWKQDAQGLINPPDEAVDEHLAFYTGQAFDDFEAESRCGRSLGDPHD